MADVEVIIKISKKSYRAACNGCMLPPDVGNVVQGIKNGTLLPKGHGDLVDISPYKGKVICSHLYSGVKKLIEVDSIKPIIEADREEQK